MSNHTDSKQAPERVFLKACHPASPNHNCSWGVSKTQEDCVEYVRADLASRASVAAVEGDAWFDIDTAPKGIDIILLWKDEHMQIHHFPVVEKPSFWYENAPIKWRHLPPLPAAASSPSPASDLPNAPDVDPNRKCWASTANEVCADPRGCDDRGCQLYADEDYRAKHGNPTSRDIRAELIAAHSAIASAPLQPAGEQERK